MDDRSVTPTPFSLFPLARELASSLDREVGVVTVVGTVKRVSFSYSLEPWDPRLRAIYFFIVRIYGVGLLVSFFSSRHAFRHDDGDDDG